VSILSNLAKKAQAEQTFLELVALFAKDKKVVTKDDVHMFPERGVVDFEMLLFTYIDGKLRMLGYCPECAAEVPSKPIRKLADIASNLDRFVPDKHECLVP